MFEGNKCIKNEILSIRFIFNFAYLNMYAKLYNVFNHLPFSLSFIDWKKIMDWKRRYLIYEKKYELFVLKVVIIES